MRGAHRLLAYILQPWRAVVAFDRHVLSIVPDKLFLKCWYRCLTGQKLNLKNPQTFNEKLNWLKLYDRKPEYTLLADKLAVKNYITKTLGEEFVVPLLGVWDNANDINFDLLPQKFVLKCNHDSASVVVYTNKDKLDKKAVCQKLNKSLKNNFYKMVRKWPYKNIKRRIFC